METEETYPQIVSTPRGFRVKTGPTTYLASLFTNGIYAEKAMQAHMIKKEQAAKRRASAKSRKK